jgi:hypothetical protein
MFGKISLVGIGIFFVVALIGASVASTTLKETQQVTAISPKGIEALVQNMSKLGVVITSTPVMCTTLSDIMGAVSGMVKSELGNMTGNGNLAGMAKGMMTGMMNKTGSLNQTEGAQGMLMKLINKTMTGSEMDNMTQSKLAKVKDLMLCSPTTEKKVEKMLK